MASFPRLEVSHPLFSPVQMILSFSVSRKSGLTIYWSRKDVYLLDYGRCQQMSTKN